LEDETFISFIRSTIRSVWALELLLLMKRRPEVWSVSDLTRELRASTRLVEGVLSHFETAGLVSQTDAGYAYQPASVALVRCCDRLEQDYAERPVAMVNLIVASSPGRVQSFADAFRLKRDDR
jgi:hypothetical protein